VSDPKPYTSHGARTIFLRCPVYDWVNIKLGMKSEFRVTGKGWGEFWNVHCPTPVVAYIIKRDDTYDQQLMVLEKTYREKLGEISPDSLSREGFPTMAHFRRYWMERTKQRFKPLSEVQVHRVRPWRPPDREIMANALLERLYGEWL